jgi:hypothetical protein
MASRCRSQRNCRSKGSGGPFYTRNGCTSCSGERLQLSCNRISSIDLSIC